MKILITGATGHSGRWFIERLKKEKFEGEIVCLAREGNDISQIENSGLTYNIVWSSIEDKRELDAAMDGVNTVIHIAGIQTSNLILRSAIENNVNWCILVHTTGRYSKFKSASSEYIKVEEEVLSMRDKINITIIRPTMIYGSLLDANMHKLILYLSKHKFFPLFGDGKNLMQPVHARDLGNSYYDILITSKRTMNKEYNLSGEKPLTYANIIKVTGKSLGAENIIVRIPLWLSINAARVYNLIFKKKAIISVEQVLRMQEDKDFGHEEAKNDFGFNPISFEAGIKEEIKEIRKARSLRNLKK